jgi:hypothetical protein
VVLANEVVSGTGSVFAFENSFDEQVIFFNEIQFHQTAKIHLICCKNTLNLFQDIW